MLKPFISNKYIKILAIIFPAAIIASLILVGMQPKLNLGRWRCVDGEWTTIGIPTKEKPTLPCPQNWPSDDFESRSIQIFMAKLDENECAILLPVERKILKDIDERMVVLEAIDELYKGPTDEEIRLGLYSEVNEDELTIRSVEIKDGVATVNTNQYLRDRNEDFCKFSRKQLQIYETLSRLPSVKQVVITTADGEIIEF